MNDAAQIRVWILDTAVRADTLERLSDARALADRRGSRVGALILGDVQDQAARLIQHGADHVCSVPGAAAGQNTAVGAAARILTAVAPRVIFAPGEAAGREIACRLAARTGWRLISPALEVQIDDQESKIITAFLVMALDSSGKRAQQVLIPSSETAIVTLRPGVAEALPPDPSRTGVVEAIECAALPEQVVARRVLPVEPATADIRHLSRLVAGGRGVGGKQGFDRLRRVAEFLGAGVAASRVAVDLGWIEYERQVGQTGKTVQPDLYIACGISGASHHLDGMSGSSHIVAINNDPLAPIHAKAHLSLVADLEETLIHLERGLAAC